MQMELSFERVKTRFGNSSQQFFEVNVPGLGDNDALRIEDGFHSMRSQDLKAIFDPVVNRIVELVRMQVAQIHAKGKTVAVSTKFYLRRWIWDVGLERDLAADMIPSGGLGHYFSRRVWNITVSEGSARDYSVPWGKDPSYPTYQRVRSSP